MSDTSRFFNFVKALARIWYYVSVGDLYEFIFTVLFIITYKFRNICGKRGRGGGREINRDR